MIQEERAVLRVRRTLHWQAEKERRIDQALSSDPIDLLSLRELASSLGGLLTEHLRKRAWPKLVGVDIFHIPPYEGPPLISHKERPQVLLDVNRCGKRIPLSTSMEKRVIIQGKLEHVLLRLLAENKELHYYQGLHDVVLTFLAVTGEDLAFAIMNILVKCHLRDFLDVDMGPTKVIISSLQPLLALEDPVLEEFLTRSECAYYFSLSWLITWYGHVIQSPSDAHRLADVFLASHPMLPVYVAAAIILTRRTEVLEQECELSSVHFLLSKLPPDLHYEQMIMLAQHLYKKHPPNIVCKKGDHKLRSSALISCYPKFLKATKTQRPDYILKHMLPSSSWWAWLTGGRKGRLTGMLLSLLGPVFLAVLIYWLGEYITTNSPSQTISYTWPF